MHARWQRSRGRNESESYRSERNPRKAVALALKDLESYEPMPGEFIGVSAINMVGRAKLTGKPCKAHFNEIPVEAVSGVDPAYIVATYKAESHRQAIAYNESPEGKKAVRDAKRRKDELQHQADAAMEMLGELDFSSLSAIIGWFKEIRDPSDHVGVNIPSENIVREFERHGYHAGVNCGDEFDSENPDNIARWLIGQALEGLKEYGSIHQVFHKFASEWQKKFGNSAEMRQDIH